MSSETKRCSSSRRKIKVPTFSRTLGRSSEGEGDWRFVTCDKKSSHIIDHHVCASSYASRPVWEIERGLLPVGVLIYELLLAYINDIY